MKKVLFNWFPPAEVLSPSPAYSILKGYLSNDGIDSDVIYWNLILDDLCRSFTPKSNRCWSDIEHLFPFFYYLQNKSENRLVELSTWYQAAFPNFFSLGKSFYIDDLAEKAQKMEERIHRMLKSRLEGNNYVLVGVQAKLYQLIPSIVFAEILRKIDPNIPIVIGGIGNKNEALSILESFPVFDSATWGEGEYPLQQLISHYNGDIPSSDVSNTVFRGNGIIYDPLKSNSDYLELDRIAPVFDDYFSDLEMCVQNGAIPEIITDEIHIPIEGGRGCHWRKCKFCFLNTGYKYRTKSPNAICKEIEDSLERFNICKFAFLDNDIIGNDNDRFNKLLLSLKKIKDDHPNLSVINAEVITKNIDEGIIRRMSLAGIDSVQIGYESTSDSLLRKIDKKNSFSSNLLFIKWALRYGIAIEGANVLMGLVGETDDDILESISNLHFLRFFISETGFKHSISKLHVMSSSPYYRSLCLNGGIGGFTENMLTRFLPNGFIPKNHEMNIFSFGNPQTNALWAHFSEIERNYQKVDYSYKIRNTGDFFRYTEYLNGEEINNLEFEESSTHWGILCFCNRKVRSVAEITDHLNGCGLSEGATEVSIIKILEELKNEYLIYSNDDFSENVAVVNVDLSH